MRLLPCRFAENLTRNVLLNLKEPNSESSIMMRRKHRADARGRSREGVPPF